MSDLTRRGFMAATAGVAGTFALSACGSSAATPPAASGAASAKPASSSAAPVTPLNIVFGYIGDYNGTSLLAIADSLKLWEKHGLKASTKVFTNGPLQITALGTGDLDFGYIGPGAFWLPASGQAKIIAINTLGSADRVIAQPGITSMDQLKGKKVGVPEGTSGDMILTLALKKAGMSKKDLQILPMDASTVVSAFSSKAIDAAGIWYPNIATIKKTVPNLVELAKNQDFEAEVAFPNAFVAGNKVVTDQPEKVKRTLKVIREAMQYRMDKKDETIKLVAAMIKQDEAAVKADTENVKALSPADLDAKTADGTVNKWLTGMGDYFVSAAKLQTNPDPKSWYLGDLWSASK
jgi:NitT/TauT family transport system substrate-binding protein